MATFTGTDNGEFITTAIVDATVTRNPPGAFPSAENDIINAGGGDDIVEGGGGDDRIHLGQGADSYFWKLGEGSDRVEGGAGLDALRLQGRLDNESIAIGTGFTRGVFVDNLGTVLLDFAGI